MSGFSIGGRVIGPGQSPYVIAEAGANHEGDLKVADQMIVEAARAGAHAVKFQTYRADRLVTRTAPRYWDEVTRRAGEPDVQIETFRKYDQFSKQDWKALADRCAQEGIAFMSSAWDEDSVDIIDDLGVPAFKIGSADITTLPLIRHTASKGKPVILSTGASRIGEIEAAVDAVRSEGNNEIALLHCVLSYPTEYKDANLQMMETLRSVFPDIPIGYSDHTHADPTMATLLAAGCLGATIIEKHYTLDRRMAGNDHYHSMEPSDIVRLMRGLEIVQAVRGQTPSRDILLTEEAARLNARRSLVAAIDIPEGSALTREMLTYKRPGHGISPADIDKIIGRVVSVAIPEDTTLEWGML